MKSPQLFLETAPSQPDPSELRDWSHLPDLILREVLQRLVPCLRSLSAFAGACRPWRRFLLASASTLLLPRIPPLLLKHERCYFGGSPGSFLLRAWSALVIRQPITSPLAAAAASTSASLLSSSRGLLIFLVRPRGLLVLVDALTGAERLSLPLPSPHAPHHYAALTTTHLVLFVSKHAFASIPFPPAAAAAPDWAHHRLPRAASFVASITEFRGRVLGVTDRAQLLEFRCLAAAAAPAPEDEAAVEMLPATGLPDAATFESWHFGPRLVVAGDRLLLLLLMTDPAHRGGATGRPVKVHRVSVHALHETPDGAMRRWEEVDNLGGYSVFVDCAGRSAVACADAAGCGDIAGNCIYFAEMTFHREYCQRYWMSLSPWWKWEHSAAAENKDAATISRKWPSQTWAYPRLFFQSSTAAQL